MVDFEHWQRTIESRIASQAASLIFLALCILRKYKGGTLSESAYQLQVKPGWVGLVWGCGGYVNDHYQNKRRGFAVGWGGFIGVFTMGIFLKKKRRGGTW